MMENGNLCRHHDNVDEVRKELQEVADALGLPIEDERVMGRWGAMPNSYNDEVYEKVFKPMYFEDKKVAIYKEQLKEFKNNWHKLTGFNSPIEPCKSVEEMKRHWRDMVGEPIDC